MCKTNAKRLWWMLAGLWLAANAALAAEPSASPAPVVGPLSAIEWLSHSVKLPLVRPSRTTPDLATQALPDISAKGSGQGLVETTRLDESIGSVVGLLSPEVTGLPADLWGAMPAQTPSNETLPALLYRAQETSLPALRGLYLTLLLAEAPAPVAHISAVDLFAERLDRLIDIGGLNQADALLKIAAGGQSPLSDPPTIFQRRLEVALLLDTPDDSCAALRARPMLSPDLAARIYCLGRAGDWRAAALALQVGSALRQLPNETEAMLRRYLDPDLFEGADPLPPPQIPTALGWRLLEGAGEPISSTLLPVRFAAADLGETTGWKARIEAAERLVREGVLAPNILLGLYDERAPAASGGVWERVRAVQALDRALALGGNDTIAQTLPEAWQQMSAADLGVAFANLYGPILATQNLVGPSGDLAFRIGLLSGAFEQIARNHRPRTVQQRLLVALALGTPLPDVALGGQTEAIVQGMTQAPPADMVALQQSGQTGQTILQAIILTDTGSWGAYPSLSKGLSMLRALGLERIARRCALELMLLERRI